VPDLYLHSTFEIWLREFERGKGIAKLRREATRTRAPLDLIHDTFRASGGAYFNGSDATDPLMAVGLKWADVYSNCEEDSDDWLQLPIENARALISAIEAHPLTREQFIRRLLECGARATPKITAKNST
jgi:hypothetical protein